jgi:formylglycine-generating enzyme required for sulfatase activity
MRHQLMIPGLLLALCLLFDIGGGISAGPPTQTGTPLQYGDTVAGEVSESVPCQVYWFDGTAGDVITIAMDRTSGNLDGVLSLYLQDGDDFTAEPVAFSDDRPTGGLDPLIETTLPATDWYTINACRLQHENMRVTEGTFDLVLTGPEGAGGGAGSAGPTPTPPSLTEDLFPPDSSASAASDTQATPTSVPDTSIGGHGARPTPEPAESADILAASDGGTLQGRLDSDSAEVTYPLLIETGAPVTIELTPDGFAPRVGVWASDDTLLAEASASEETSLLLVFTPTAPGEVTLVIGRHASEDAQAAGSFTVQVGVQTERTVPAVSGTPLPAGSPNAAWTPFVREINGLSMVYVPGGCFVMGSDDIPHAAPAHTVCLSGYWIGQTEITNAQYRACIDAGVCTPPNPATRFDDPAKAENPVTCIDWQQASTYAVWVGGSLPTEAQWEYAARGPESWPYPWGETQPTCEQANIAGCDDVPAAAPDTREAGASWVGALDLSGNVAEWVTDHFDRAYYASLPDGVLDPTGPESGRQRTTRGGYYRSNPDAALAANRQAQFPTDRSPGIGFRVIMVSSPD